MIWVLRAFKTRFQLEEVEAEDTKKVERVEELEELEDIKEDTKKIYYYYRTMNSPIIIVLIEANLVGLFSITITFFLLSTFFSLKNNNLMFFFILGFLKHYLGYITGLQNWYCKKRNKETNETTGILVKTKEIQPSLLQNIQEGFAFIIVSFLIQKIFKIKDIYFIAFLTGFILHLLAEFTGIHTIFCKKMV